MCPITVCILKVSLYKEFVNGENGNTVPADEGRGERRQSEIRNACLFLEVKGGL